MRIPGGKKLAVLVVVLAYLLKKTYFWTWLIFSVDYFLGNPGPFGAYRNRLMEQMYRDWPIPDGVFIPPQHFQELLGTNYTHKYFKQVSEGYTRPVILRGLFNDSQALKWTPEYMVDQIGDDRLFVAFLANSLGGGAPNAATFLTTLKDAVKNISNGGNNYLFNSNLEYPRDLKLYREIGAERIDWKPPVIIQFFLGLTRPGETRVGGSPMHAAVAPNINIQLSGEKTWIMIDPKYANYMKPNLLSDQVALFVGSGLDYGHNRRFENMPRYQGVVRPGDAIFIPSWWMHEVHNRPGDSWQISLAIRYTNAVSSLWNNWLFTELVDWGTPNKPCWRGFRLLCFEFGAWESTFDKDHTKSAAALEMNKRMHGTTGDAVVRNYE
jgi:hypothetical protein